jgi:hypothetical protein
MGLHHCECSGNAGCISPSQSNLLFYYRRVFLRHASVQQLTFLKPSVLACMPATRQTGGRAPTALLQLEPTAYWHALPELMQNIKPSQLGRASHEQQGNKVTGLLVITRKSMGHTAKNSLGGKHGRR